MRRGVMGGVGLMGLMRLMRLMGDIFFSWIKPFWGLWVISVYAKDMCPSFSVFADALFFF